MQNGGIVLDFSVPKKIFASLSFGNLNTDSNGVFIIFVSKTTPLCAPPLKSSVWLKFVLKWLKMEETKNRSKIYIFYDILKA